MHVYQSAAPFNNPSIDAPSHPSNALQAQPDMLMFAKGIASGFPFAGVSARPELYSKMSPGMMVSHVAPHMM